MEESNEKKNDVKLQGDPQPDQAETGPYDRIKNLNDDKNLNFGEALQIMKNGGVVAREGWNGKDMYVYINKGSYPPSDKNDETPAFCRRIRMKLFALGDKNTNIRLPNFNMFTADGCSLNGWAPTQTDLLSEDWFLIEKRVW